jgi:phage terminase Nu1 subunit (DNA packaging protein)
VDVTARELSSLLGCSPRHLRRLAAAGLPGPTSNAGGRGKAALYDLGSVLAWQRTAAAVADAPASSARDRYLLALATKAELDVAVRRGELVEQAEVDRDAADVALRTRARLRAVPSAVVTQVVADAPERRAEVHGLLLRAIDEALRELAALGRSGKGINDDTRAGAQTDPGGVLSRARPRRRAGINGGTAR